MVEITNGDLARDFLSGFQGTVVCISKWLYGCRRLTLQPPGLDQKGAPLDSQTFDEDQLELVETKEEKGTPTGGPRSEPVRTVDPK